MGNAQSRREAREAQRRKTVRRRIAFSGAGIILLCGGVLAYNIIWQPPTDSNQTSIPSECTTTQRVTVETTEAMAGVLKKIPVDSDLCITLSISHGKRASDIAREIINGKTAPNLWIPDSSTRAELALTGKAIVIAKSDSLAKSPGVVVSRPDQDKLETWNTVFSATDTVQLSNPRQDSGAFLAMMNAAAEITPDTAAEEELDQEVVSRAENSSDKTPTERIEAVVTGESLATVVSESDYIDYRRQHPDTELSAYVPSTGTGELDFPMYQPATSNQTNKTVSKAADKISEYLASDEGKKALAEAGLRSADGTCRPDGNIGTVTPLETQDAQLISSIWITYLQHDKSETKNSS